MSISDDDDRALFQTTNLVVEHIIRTKQHIDPELARFFVPKDRTFSKRLHLL